MAPPMLPAAGVIHRRKDYDDSVRSSKAIMQRRGSMEPRELPMSVTMQRALIKWMSHSRFGAIFTQMGVTVANLLPLLSLLLVLRRAWRLSRLVRRLKRSFLVVAVKTALESWAVLEVAFWMYFRWKRHNLEARRAYTPASLYKAPGERMKLLKNFLANIDRIDAGNLEGLRHGSRRLSRQSSPEDDIQAKGIQGVLTPQSKDRTEAATRKMRQLVSAPSVENFLRYQDEQHENTSVCSDDVMLERGGATPRVGISPRQSVDNLLRCWSSEAVDKLGGPGSKEGRNELMCFRHLELCSWYSLRMGSRREICCDVNEIRRGNLEEWILSYWFDGADTAQVLNAAERIELEELVDEAAKWAGLPQDPHDTLWFGKNPKLHCFRIRNDPFPAMHRPLFTYSFTAFVFPAVGNQALMMMGFRPYRSGSTEYWVRPPCPDSSWVRRLGGARPTKLNGGGAAAGHLPLVFCHGIGVGPTMCLSFIMRIVRAFGEEHPLFLVDTAAVSMRFSDDVPCAREIAQNVADMLEVWGFQKAHFVGHSFGSFVLSWMNRYQRSYVKKLSFIDPVCFMVLKVFVESHELQQVRHVTRMDTMEIFVKYFVLTELFVCNFVCRCFFWEESHLDMQDLEGIEALLVLESEDTIVPTHSVQRLVTAERQRRRARLKESPTIVGPESHSGPNALDVCWVEGQPHGGFLVDAPVARQMTERLLAFHTGSPPPKHHCAR